MKLSNPQKAVIALIIANFIWGAAPPIFKWALQDIQPFTLAFLRFFIASLLIFPFIYNRLKINSKDIFKVVVMGIFGISFHISFFFQGLLYTQSINTTIIASTGPVFIVMFALLFMKEKPGIKVVLGTFLGLLGVLVFLIVPFLNSGDLSASYGNLLILLATLSTMLYLILGRQVMKRNHPLTITFWTFIIGSFGFLPFFIDEVSMHGFMPNLTIHSIVGIIFGALFSSLIAYQMHNYALKFMSAADVGIFAYLDPIVTVLVAAPLLGEFPDLIFIIGSILVFGGIFIAEGRIHYHPIHKLSKN